MFPPCGDVREFHEASAFDASGVGEVRVEPVLGVDVAEMVGD